MPRPQPRSNTQCHVRTTWTYGSTSMPRELGSVEMSRISFYNVKKGMSKLSKLSKLKSVVRSTYSSTVVLSRAAISNLGSFEMSRISFYNVKKGMSKLSKLSKLKSVVRSTYSSTIVLSRAAIANLGFVDMSRISFYNVKKCLSKLSKLSKLKSVVSRSTYSSTVPIVSCSVTCSSGECFSSMGKLRCVKESCLILQCFTLNVIA